MDGRVRTAFFALLRAGLGLEPLTAGEWLALSPGDWEDLYAEARRHTVRGVVFDAMTSLPSDCAVPIDILAKWAADVSGMEKNYRLKQAVQDAQARAWKRESVDATALKGLTVAAMYPEPEHRESGDIDWWLAGEDDWRKANEMASAHARLETDSDGDVHYVFHDVVIEHHRRWNDASSRRARKALAPLRPDCPQAILTMMNLHILKHAMVFGIGMRQICDLAVAYRHFDGRYDRSGLMELMSSCGLEKWTALLDSSLVDMLGEGAVPAGRMEELGNVPERDVARLRELILADGDFGFDAGRSAKAIAGSLLRRSGLFLRYAPGEFSARLSGLAVGRLKIK